MWVWVSFSLAATTKETNTPDKHPHFIFSCGFVFVLLLKVKRKVAFSFRKAERGRGDMYPERMAHMQFKIRISTIAFALGFKILFNGNLDGE
jgi:hypothetical protein